MTDVHIRTSIGLTCDVKGPFYQHFISSIPYHGVLLKHVFFKSRKIHNLKLIHNAVIMSD